MVQRRDGRLFPRQLQPDDQHPDRQYGTNTVSTYGITTGTDSNLHLHAEGRLVITGNFDHKRCRQCPYGQHHTQNLYNGGINVAGGTNSGSGQAAPLRSPTPRSPSAPRPLGPFRRGSLLTVGTGSSLTPVNLNINTLTLSGGTGTGGGTVTFNGKIYDMHAAPRA